MTVLGDYKRSNEFAKAAMGNSNDSSVVHSFVGVDGVLDIYAMLSRPSSATRLREIW